MLLLFQPIIVSKYLVSGNSFVDEGIILMTCRKDLFFVFNIRVFQKNVIAE
jgi:hypothetical protein